MQLKLFLEDSYFVIIFTWPVKTHFFLKRLTKKKGKCKIVVNENPSTLIICISSLSNINEKVQGKQLIFMSSILYYRKKYMEL